MGPVAKSAGTPSARFAYRKLTPCGTGLTPEEIATNQRARMYAAMIDTVAERGYAGTSIGRLRTLASVSMDAIYREFHSKEGYFLATFDVIVLRAVERVTEAYRGEQDWTRQLHAAFRAFASEVVDQPRAARFALIETLGAGPKALAHMERGTREFENMIQAAFARAPDGVTVPPVVVRGIVGGISRVTRQLLLEEREQELPEFADMLVQWALSYRSRAAQALPAPPSPSPDPRVRLTARRAGVGIGHNRILRSALQIAARAGYAHLTASEIIRTAGVPDNTFFELYQTSEDCFLAAYDRAGAALVASGAQAARSGGDWQESIQNGISALMQRLAADPVFARCAFVEVFAVGPAGIDRRSRLMDDFTTLLLNNIPPDERPSRIVAEAIVGGIWQVAHGYVIRDATQQLTQLPEHASYLVLAPIIGADKAMDRIRPTRREGIARRSP